MIATCAAPCDFECGGSCGLLEGHGGKHHCDPTLRSRAKHVLLAIDTLVKDESARWPDKRAIMLALNDESSGNLTELLAWFDVDLPSPALETLDNLTRKTAEQAAEVRSMREALELLKSGAELIKLTAPDAELSRVLVYLRTCEGVPPWVLERLERKDHRA